MRIVIGIAPDAEVTINAGPALRHLQRRIVGVQFPLVFLALADLVEGKLLDPFVRAVTAEEHLDELVDRRFLRDQQAFVLGLREENDKCDLAIG
jgi:hypothetical protein